MTQEGHRVHLNQKMARIRHFQTAALTSQVWASTKPKRSKMTRNDPGKVTGPTRTRKYIEIVEAIFEKYLYCQSKFKKVLVLSYRIVAFNENPRIRNLPEVKRTKTDQKRKKRTNTGPKRTKKRTYQLKIAAR